MALEIDLAALKSALAGADDVIARWNNLVARGVYHPERGTDAAADRRATLGQAGKDERAGLGKRELLAMLVAVGGSTAISNIAAIVGDLDSREQIRQGIKAAEDSGRQAYQVDGRYAAEVSRREYADPFFNNAAEASQRFGEAALHDSFYHARRGDPISLTRNLVELGRALEATPDDKLARTAILQRIAVGNILLGRASSARTAMHRINWEDIQSIPSFVRATWTSSRRPRSRP